LNTIKEKRFAIPEKVSQAWKHINSILNYPSSMYNYQCFFCALEVGNQLTKDLIRSVEFHSTK